MLGHKERGQLELFITGSLRDLIPDDHVLMRIDEGLGLGWLRVEVAGLYCADNGRHGIDPEVAVRLLREAQVRGGRCGRVHISSRFWSYAVPGSAPVPWSRP